MFSSLNNCTIDENVLENDMIKFGKYIIDLGNKDVKKQKKNNVNNFNSNKKNRNGC